MSKRKRGANEPPGFTALWPLDWGLTDVNVKLEGLQRMGLPPLLLLGGVLLLLRALRQHRAQVSRRLLLSAFATVGLSNLLVALPDSWTLLGNSGAWWPELPFGSVAVESVLAWAEPATATLNPERHTSWPAQRGAPSLAQWIALVWLLGTCLLCGRLTLRVFRAQALLKRAYLQNPEPESVRSYPVLLTNLVEAPVVLGVWRPAILLPQISESWNTARRQAILLHEIAHLKHRDSLGLLGAEVVTILHWWQPLGWLCLRALRLSCEQDADEAVLSEGVKASDYAGHLLALATEASAHTRALAAAEPSALGRRLERLLDPRGRSPVSRRRRLALQSASAGLCAAAIAVAAPWPRHVPAVPGAEAALFQSNAERPPGKGIEALQQLLEQKSAWALAHWQARRAALLVLDARKGTLLAEQDTHPGELIPVASTFKSVTLALALDAGAITSDQLFDIGSGPRFYPNGQLRDASTNQGWLSTADIIARSSNIGTSLIFDQMGAATLVDGMRRFGFQPPESRVLDSSLKGALLAIGHEVVASPRLLAETYGVFANGGVIGSSGRRLISTRAAKNTVSLLQDAVQAPQSTGGAARVAGVAVGGKTGSSEVPSKSALFVGIVPTGRGPVVILVSIGGARRSGWGGTIAAPLFAELATGAMRLLSR